MFNPWMLAAGVFFLMGMVDEFQKGDAKETKALPDPKKEPAAGASVTVNVDGTAVKSEGKKSKVKGKPSAEVPSQPTGDG